MKNTQLRPNELFEPGPSLLVVDNGKQIELTKFESFNNLIKKQQSTVVMKLRKAKEVNMLHSPTTNLVPFLKLLSRQSCFFHYLASLLWWHLLPVF